METEFIDLHTHSTASDGTDTPTQLVQHAIESGVKAIALTDHDTISGLDEFLSAGQHLGMDTIPGVEISTKVDKYEIHIVGLLIDPANAELNEKLKMLRDARLTRNAEIIRRLNEGGYAITEAEVAEVAKGESIGRPHIAQVLINKGYFRNLRQVFSCCLRIGARFFVPRQYLSLQQAIEVIHHAGGVAIWAHPMLQKGSNINFLRKMLQEMRPYGLDGIEARYTDFTIQQNKSADKIAAEFGLLSSGGSDYHGSCRPDVKIGEGNGTLLVPYAFLKRIREYHKAKRN